MPYSPNSTALRLPYPTLYIEAAKKKRPKLNKRQIACWQEPFETFQDVFRYSTQTFFDKS